MLVTRAVMPFTVQHAPPACGTGGFDHLGVRFVSVQDEVDTNSPMGRAMFIIIGALAELGLSLISECVTAGMRAAEARGLHLGRPGTPPRIVSEIEALAMSTDLSVRAIQKKIVGQASRGIVGEITKSARTNQPETLGPLFKRVLDPRLERMQVIGERLGSNCGSLPLVKHSVDAGAIIRERPES